MTSSSETDPHTRQDLQNDQVLPDSKHVRVLIVEDNPIFQEQLSNAASKLAPHCIIHCVSSGAEYQTITDPIDNSFDVALIDLGLPDISGIDIIRDLRDRSPDTIVLVISVISNQDSVIGAIRAGAHGYILKGESEANITSAIADVMAGNYPISPALARHLFRSIGSEEKGQEPKVQLTAREQDTLQYIASGLSYAEVAKEMNVSLSTVQTHIRSLYKKFDARSQVQAINKARSAGLIK